MDTEKELARTKWLVGAAAFFLLSGCVSWNELYFWAFGRAIDADVLRTYEATRGRNKWGGGGQRQLTVEFAFTEPDGTLRSGSDNVATDWPLPTGGKVPVQYTPGENGSSRLAGHVNWTGLILFGISLFILGVFGFLLWREATDTEPKPRRKKGAR